MLLDDHLRSVCPGFRLHFQSISKAARRVGGAFGGSKSNLTVAFFRVHTWSTGGYSVFLYEDHHLFGEFMLIGGSPVLWDGEPMPFLKGIITYRDVGLHIYNVYDKNGVYVRKICAPNTESALEELSARLPGENMSTMDIVLLH